MVAKNKKQSHCVIRNGKLFCLHCGGEQILPLPIGVEMFSAMCNTFQKIHKSCKKTWKEPEVDPSWSERSKAIHWLKYCEHGNSSLTIFSVIFRTLPEYREYELGMRKDLLSPVEYCHPYDPSDFNRCYKLLQVVPEWREKLYLMKPVSPVWNKLVDNWGKLTDMLERNVKEEWVNAKEIGMYEFMQELIK